MVKHNKKVSNKITSLSTKLTEVRCIMTQVQNANMCQWLISHFLFGSQGNSFVFGRYLDLHLTHHMVKFYWSRPLKIYGLGWYFTGIKKNKKTTIEVKFGMLLFVNCGTTPHFFLPWDLLGCLLYTWFPMRNLLNPFLWFCVL